ncbi:MAG: DUF4412 domain-containing protein [Bacteroidota bacterium]
MKNIITLLLAIVFSAGAATAQETFQGTLNYGFKFSGEGIEQAQAMLPTGMEMIIRKSDVIVEMQGGMMAMMMGKILTLGKKGKTYMIKDSEETIYVMDVEKMKDDAGDAPKPKITKEDETLTIAGYECQKYKVTMETPQGEMTQQVWVTDQIKLPKSEGAGGPGGGLTSGLTMEGLPGLPLKTMINQGPITVIMTAKTVDPGVPDKKLFKLPKGYDKEEFDMKSMMGGMGGM